MRIISLKDKRGAEEERTVNWVIALIILVLAVIAVWWAYTTFKGGTFPWQKSSISTTVQACAAACTGSDTYGYCSQDRKVELSTEDFKKYETALKLLSAPDKYGEKVDLKKHAMTATCKQFAGETGLKDWAISTCESISCS